MSVGRVLDDLAMHITTGKLLEALGFTDSTELSLTMHHALLQSGVAVITIILILQVRKRGTNRCHDLRGIPVV